MKSVMTHQFSRVPQVEIPRSSFDRSCGYKTTITSAGDIVPVFFDFAWPGDTFNLQMSVFTRMATPMKPIMDNLYLDSFFFAVPIRILWSNWKKFNGEQLDPQDSIDFVVPTVPAPATTGALTGSLWDYFGLPLGKPSLVTNALFFRCYNACWNTWFRDENLQDPAVQATGDGPDQSSAYIIRKRGKRHDYFTSCLPWPQKGNSVKIPLGTSAEVLRTNNAQAYGVLQAGGNSPVVSATTLKTNTLGELGALSPDVNISFQPKNNPAQPSALYADLTTATAASINQLRQGFAFQRVLERDARGGTRYPEFIKNFFGVTSDDARMQRPELLNTTSTPINIHPVAQTSESTDETPQGNLAAFATASFSGHGFTKSFTEHCVIMGMVSVRADLTYQQGLSKLFSYSTRFDWYLPPLAHLGEMAVKNKEIYYQGTADDELVFGYQEAFAELRYKPSLVTGVFRSDHAQSLDLWHLSQDFASLPVLNDTFIQENPPIARVIAVPTEPQFLFDAYFDLKCARPMPLYGVPGMIDHF